MARNGLSAGLGAIFGSLALVAVVLSALVVFPLDKDVILAPIERNLRKTPASAPIDAAGYKRETLTFPLLGEQGEAWLYTPKNPLDGPSTRPPVVVMAHGIGAQKEMGLHEFAATFAEKGGIAAFVIDYRCFGGSGGEPRNHASPKRHVADIVASVEYVKSSLSDKIDPQRVALWGSSLAGGHAIVAGAALGERVAAVVSQVPHLSGKAASKANLKKRGPLGVLRLGAAAILDTLRGVAGLPPAYVTLAGRPGQLAFMQLADEELREYFAKHPAPAVTSASNDGDNDDSKDSKDSPSSSSSTSAHSRPYQGGWQNRILARFALEIARYEPGSYIKKLRAPLLLVVAREDTQCPPEAVATVVEGAKRARSSSSDSSLPPLDITVEEIDAAHFQVYQGEKHELAKKKELDFLVERLRLKE